MFFVPMITLGYVLVLIINVGFVGSGRIPTVSVLAQGYGWVLLATCFDLLISVGFASLVGSRVAAVAVLLGWQFLEIGRAHV